jgi:cysteine-rich repeat protein
MSSQSVLLATVLSTVASQCVDHTASFSKSSADLLTVVVDTDIPTDSLDVTLVTADVSDVTVSATFSTWDSNAQLLTDGGVNNDASWSLNVASAGEEPAPAGGSSVVGGHDDFGDHALQVVAIPAFMGLLALAECAEAGVMTFTLPDTWIISETTDFSITLTNWDHCPGHDCQDAGDLNAQCVDNSGTVEGYSCSCSSGFEDIDGVCQPICGDGQIVDGEQGCDDGNNDNGDGCSASCSIEAGWECDENGCAPICGDGVMISDEGCDDGNDVNGDGCSADCQVESGWDCDENGCVDIDSCANTPCGDQGSACHDVAAPGTGYSCDCNQDYVFDGDTCVSESQDWLVGERACNGADYGGGCQSYIEPGYHWVGEYDGYKCWWHTKNQAWNTDKSTNFYYLAQHFGLDISTSRCSWCHSKSSTPSPSGYYTSYREENQVGAWGWCGGSLWAAGGFICFSS